MINSENTNDIELAWAAGFFEGEGYVGCHKPKGCLNYQHIISISQIDKRPLERFSKAVGEMGSFFLEKRKTKNWNDVWRWHATSKQAREVMELLRPYLSGRKLDQLNAVEEKIKLNYKEPMSMKERSKLAVEGKRRARSLRVQSVL